MAREKTVFVCSECGASYPRWSGRCSHCGSWNTLTETRISGKAKKAAAGGNPPVLLKDIQKNENVRIGTGMEEADRVLGGGFVTGGVVMLAGDPGIGKSTLALQAAEKISGSGDVLYISGEESGEQISLRAGRAGINSDRLFVLSETDAAAGTAAMREMNPLLTVVDSIQTQQSEDIPSPAGSPLQLRETASMYIKAAKENGNAVLIIGHVTKEGSVAGPKVLEHMMDAVLYLEGERYNSYRILRSFKNRFGSTSEAGIFEMAASGLREVRDPAGIFLQERAGSPYGSVIVPCLEGTRPVLMEVQALLGGRSYGQPRRVVNGADYNRFAMLTAVLEKRTGLKISDREAYLNIAGGVKMTETAADLGICTAVFSGEKEIPVPSDTVVFGEVGLTGEIRTVPFAGRRAAEAVRLGFKRVVMPRCSFDAGSRPAGEIVFADSLSDALEKVFKK